MLYREEFYLLKDFQNSYFSLVNTLIPPRPPKLIINKLFLELEFLSIYWLITDILSSNKNKK